MPDELGPSGLVRPRVVLEDGNAYAILGACRSAAKRAGWAPEEWVEFKLVATKGEYMHLLAAVGDYFDAEIVTS